MMSFTLDSQRLVHRTNAIRCFVLLTAVSCCSGVPLHETVKIVYPLRSDSESSAMADMAEQLGTTMVDLGSLLDAGHGAVVTLVSGDTRLAAHRAVLAAGSPVLAGMVRPDVLEASGSEVDIPDVEGPVLRQLVAFLYTGRAPQLPGVTPQLLAAAKKYGVSGLSDYCEQYVPDHLSVENAAATAILAVRDSCHSLLRAAISFIKGHLEVMLTQGWADAVHKHPVNVVHLIHLLAETSSSTPAGSTPTNTAIPAATTAVTRPHSDHGQTAATAALPTAARDFLPPDVPVIYHLHATTAADNMSTSTATTTANPTSADSMSNSTYTVATSTAPMGCHKTHLPDAAAVHFFRTFTGDERNRRLRKAAQEGAEQEVSALLAAGADVGARDGRGWTALHEAASRGHVPTVQCLLHAGAGVDTRTTGYQSTPLHVAAVKGHAAVAKLLLASSADVGARDEEGMTPLHWAAYWGQAEVAAALLEAGADKVARNDDGDTPLHLACQRNHYQLMHMLK